MPEKLSAAPLLSVVAVSRNDDHGGSMLSRMQHFVDGFVAQCRRHRLSAELVLVEWNPPAGRRPLAEALRWPEDLGSATVRVITVPPEVHATFENADKLPLFQMIGKNVGIRRARGAFVLATNIDILFSDAIVRYFRESLRPGRLLRADRCDVPPDLPSDVPFDQVLAFCAREMFRVNARGRTLIKQNGKWVNPARVTIWQWLRRRFYVRRWLQAGGNRLCAIWRSLSATLREAPRLWGEAPRLLARILARGPGEIAKVVLIRGPIGVLSIVGKGSAAFVGRVRAIFNSLCESLRRLLPSNQLHTNACGDFTLLAREDWFRVRGYPEWPIYSWHIDSVLVYQANRSRIREIDLPRNKPIYHIEHAPGSGYTPEAADLLFKRLEARGIPYLSYPDLLDIIRDMDANKKSGRPVLYNDLDWGLANVALEEWSPRARGGMQS